VTMPAQAHIAERDRKARLDALFNRPGAGRRPGHAGAEASAG
jgi:hypothetical protein